MASTPPLPPLAIVDRLRGHFAPEPPIDLVVQRAEREEGKRARTEASAARVDLTRWLESTGWKR